MTREEALNKTIGILTYHQVNFCKSKEAVANMNEIIEALEKIDQEPCEDCISLEAVMHILDEVGGDFDSPREAVVPIDYIADMVAELSSVSPQPCDDAISRQAVLGLFAQNADAVRPYSKTWEEVKALPFVTAQQKVGHWEWNQYDANPKIGNFHCSECHSIGRSYFDYCPYCGAKMSEIPTGAEGSEE